MRQASFHQRVEAPTAHRQARTADRGTMPGRDLREVSHLLFSCRLPQAGRNDRIRGYFSEEVQYACERKIYFLYKPPERRIPVA
jgi:hypothetical protein